DTFRPSFWTDNESRMAKRQPEWFSEQGGFFGPSYFAEHVQMLSPETTLNEVNFLKESLNLEQGARILDVACGYGRHAVPLARLGCAVTGLDCNAFLLEQGKKAAAAAGVTVRWVKSDMRLMPFDGAFDVVVHLYNSFGYFDADADHQRVLDEVRRAL